ncbi:MAG: MBL fold metallo-hydrolase [Clostridium sp.]
MIKVLASGSKGNCYTIQAGGEILLLECGIAWKKGILKGLNFDISNVVGCLLTHSHLDHSSSIKDVVNSGIDVYSTPEVFQEIGIGNSVLAYHLLPIQSGKEFKVGNFTIVPFNCKHTHNNGEECPMVNYLIFHPLIGKIVFITDTFYCKYVFKGCKHILIECNYSESILADLPPYRARLLKSHMSLETLKEALQTWDLKETKDITLIHMSENHGEPDHFREEIEKVTGVKTIVAVPGLEIN